MAVKLARKAVQPQSSTPKMRLGLHHGYQFCFTRGEARVQKVEASEAAGCSHFTYALRLKKNSCKKYRLVEKQHELTAEGMCKF